MAVCWWVWMMEQIVFVVIWEQLSNISFDSEVWHDHNWPDMKKNIYIRSSCAIPFLKRRG